MIEFRSGFCFVEEASVKVLCICTFMLERGKKTLMATLRGGVYCWARKTALEPP